MPISNSKFKELPETVNELIADRAIRHALYLERYKTQMVNDILTEFNKTLAPELIAKIEQSLERITLKSKRMQILFKDNGELVKAEYKVMEAKLYEQLRDFAKVESSWLIKTLENITPIAIDFVAPSANILKSLVINQPMEGALVKDWFDKLSRDTAFNINRAIQNGMIEGQGIADIVRVIKGTRASNYSDGILNAPRHNLNSIIRTSVSNVAHAARDEVYAANTDVVKGVQIIATLDVRTCMECMNLDGKVFEVGEGRRPPFHHSCLPGDSLVTSSSRIVSASKRWFYGEMFIIETASGRKLTCTPNHPILTNNGWLAANRLDVGSNVVCDGGRQWETAFVDIHSKNIPAPIEDIFESSLGSPDMLAVPVPLTAEDFHGDGMGGQIAIIASNRFLRNSTNASINQHLPQFNFITTNKTFRYILFSAKRNLTSFFFSAFPALTGFMGSLCQFSNDRRWGYIHPGLLLLAAVPQRNSILFENSQNRLPRTFKSFGYPLCTNSIFVKFKNFIFRQINSSGLNASQRHSGLNKNSSNNLISYIKSTGYTPRGFSNAIRFINFFRRQMSLVSSDSDMLPLQNTGDSANRDSILAANILSGKAGEIFLDNVINVRKFNFAGHVYNLETKNNFYSSQGIITHNCRCSDAPVLKSWKELGINAKELDPGTRASMNGQVAATQTYPAWLKKQETDIQNEALGVGRAELFRSGQLKLNDFIDRLNKPLTLKELEKLAG